jgi:hypothetical protein
VGVDQVPDHGVDEDSVVGQLVDVDSTAGISFVVDGLFGAELEVRRHAAEGSNRGERTAKENRQYLRASEDPRRGRRFSRVCVD